MKEGSYRVWRVKAEKLHYGLTCKLYLCFLISIPGQWSHKTTQRGTDWKRRQSSCRRSSEGRWPYGGRTSDRAPATASPGTYEGSEVHVRCKETCRERAKGVLHHTSSEVGNTREGITHKWFLLPYLRVVLYMYVYYVCLNKSYNKTAAAIGGYLNCPKE